jgi:hypothetical protein
MRSFGAKVGFDKTVPSEANSTDAQTLATELKQAGVKNVYMLTSPIFWLQVAHAAATQNYHPTWIGVQEAEDELLQAGCQNNAVAGAEMFHMVPGFVDANRFDPDFAKAGGADDIEWILWGLDKEIAATLALPGKNLTRERFVYYLERAHKIQTGVAPALSFSPSHHFGGTALHLLRADCSTEHWVTQRAFVSHF